MLKGEDARNVPRWFEPSSDLISHFRGRGMANPAATSRTALHLSNILKYNFTESPGVMDVTETRALHAQLCGLLEMIEQTLSQLQYSEIVTWAPTDNGQLLQVATAMKNLAGRNVRAPRLLLVMPIDPYPGCEQVSDVLDIWGHPLMGKRWHGIVQSITVLAQPTRIIVPGLHAPMHRLKSIAFFSLEPTLQPPTCDMLNWRNILFEYDIGPVVVVDIPTSEAVVATHLLQSLQIPGLRSLDLPRPSLGSTSGAPRSAIHVHLGQNTATPLFMEMVMPWLRKELQSVAAVVGCTKTVASPTAMLMDTPNAATALTHAEGCWSAMIVSPRLVLFETHRDAAWWRNSLTEAWNSNPDTAAERIHHRPSSGITANFAKTSATPEQIATARAQRARKGHASRRHTLSCPDYDRNRHSRTTERVAT